MTSDVSAQDWDTEISKIFPELKMYLFEEIPYRKALKQDAPAYAEAGVEEDDDLYEEDYHPFIVAFTKDFQRLISDPQVCGLLQRMGDQFGVKVTLSHGGIFPYRDPLDLKGDYLSALFVNTEVEVLSA